MQGRPAFRAHRRANQKDNKLARLGHQRDDDHTRAPIHLTGSTMPAVLASEGVDYASEPALPAKIAYSLSGLLPRVAPALLSSDDSAHQPAL